MITQDKSYDKSMNGFIPKENGEVDLVGKLFIRRSDDYEKFGTGTLVCGVLFGFDWGEQQTDEMWEVEVNIKPIKRFIDDLPNKPGESLEGFRIDQVMCSEWDRRENYREIT